MRKISRLVLWIVAGIAFVALVQLGAVLIIRTYQDWEFDRSLGGVASDDSTEDLEPPASSIYKVTLPLCESSTMMELASVEAKIWCEDKSDFRVEINPDLVKKIIEIEGITDIDVTADTIVFKKSEDYYWLPLLQKATPILLMELEGSR